MRIATVVCPGVSGCHGTTTPAVPGTARESVACSNSSTLSFVAAVPPRSHSIERPKASETSSRRSITTNRCGPASRRWRRKWSRREAVATKASFNGSCFGGAQYRRCACARTLPVVIMLAFTTMFHLLGVPGPGPLVLSRVNFTLSTSQKKPPHLRWLLLPRLPFRFWRIAPSFRLQLLSRVPVQPRTEHR